MIESKKVEKKEENSYPCLKIDSGAEMIILFTRKNCGTCVFSAGDNAVGVVSEDWDESLCVLFDGQVILNNEVINVE